MTNYEGKKVVRLEIEHLRGDKLKAFIAFCFQISDMVSLSTNNIKYKKKLEAYQLIKREKTYETHCTRGPKSLVCYFKVNSELENCFVAMEDLFDRVELEKDCTTYLDDPAFYKDNELKCSICSHEHMGRLLLSEDEYTFFRALRIPHSVCNSERVWSLEEWIEECIYQEREEFCIHGYGRESIPEEIGEMITLKKLEIFDYQVKQLPKTLENLVGLECLRITGNQVEELGFDLSKLKHLRELDLSSVPLKTFPEGISQLSELEKLYMSGICIDQVPESLLQLKKLRVLSLPERVEEKASEVLKAFIQQLKPRRMGISLVEILGEETIQRMREEGSCIVLSGME